jgi:AhpD family alkylhydroperoxidase
LLLHERSVEEINGCGACLDSAAMALTETL